jgi:hypothetical protein
MLRARWRIIWDTTVLATRLLRAHAPFSTPTAVLTLISISSTTETGIYETIIKADSQLEVTGNTHNT